MMHTPLPWTNNKHSVYVHSEHGNICACGHPRASTRVGYTEAGLSDGLNEAVDNARLIVRAVNSHDALVKALKDVIAVYEWCSVDPVDRGYSSLDDEIASARRALAMLSEQQEAGSK